MTDRVEDKILGREKVKELRGQGVRSVNFMS